MSTAYPGGPASLALLALLNSGVPADDQLIRRGLEFLRGVERKQTYVVGLQTMVFALAGQEEDLAAIRRNADWLVAQGQTPDGKFRGWGYPEKDYPPDNSNTQYALLGLHEAQRAGALIKPEVWQSIRDYYIRTQIKTQNSGGWGYRRGLDPNLTMTTAGLCGLLITGMETNVSMQTFSPDERSVQNCGVYKESNGAVTMAIRWIGDNFPPTDGKVADWRHSDPEFPGPNVYYSLYGIQRTGG